MQRPALTLAGGILYAAYGSHDDTDPYHGWVIGFNATNLVLLTNYVFNTTPNATYRRVRHQCWRRRAVDGRQRNIRGRQHQFVF